MDGVSFEDEFTWIGIIEAGSDFQLKEDADIFVARGEDVYFWIFFSQIEGSDGLFVETFDTVNYDVSVPAGASKDADFWKRPHFVVARLTSNGLSIRVDDGAGDLSGSKTLSEEFPGFTGIPKAALGANPHTDGVRDTSAFKGYVDEVMVLKSAISDSQVDALYSDYKAGRQWFSTTRPTQQTLGDFLII